MWLVVHSSRHRLRVKSQLCCCYLSNRADNRELGPPNGTGSLPTHPHLHKSLYCAYTRSLSIYLTMNARQHKRSQSNGLKPPTAHARSNRPSLSAKRNASYNHAAVTHPSANLRRQKSSTEIVKQSDTDSSEDMAASFLQFWYVPVDPPLL